MKTLVIGKIWPEPLSSAAGTRTMNLLHALLDANWELVFATTAQPSEHSEELSVLGITCERIAVNDSSFDTWVAELNPDVVIFDRYMIEEQFGWRVEKYCPHALRVLDTSDLHCLREARGQSLKQGAPSYACDVDGVAKGLDLFNDIALREIASIYRSDLTFMISEVEIEILKDVFHVPESLLGYLPFMLDLPESYGVRFEDRHHFVMIGSYMHEPNWDAVRWCVQSIWPIIREALPEAELHVYGSYQPPKARQLHNPKSGVMMLGRAGNAIEILSHYRANLAPLRFGAGQKGKLADGFVAGTPGVATPIAAESMNGMIDWGCAIESDPAAFAREAVLVYSDRDIWERVQRQGREIARKRLSKTEWADVFIKRLIVKRESLKEGRYENFIGSMLRHHQHRSTEFMSRWIETKTHLQKACDK